MLPVDRVGRSNNRDRAQLVDTSARLLDCEADIVHRNLTRELEPLLIAPAVVVGPIVVGARKCRRVIGCNIVVRQNLPTTRAVRYRDIDAFDVHRGQRRSRIKAARTGHLQVRTVGAASSLKIPRLAYRSLRVGERGNNVPLHLHTENSIGVVLVLFVGGKAFFPLAEEPWRAYPVGLIEIAYPQILGLHQMKIAIHDQKAFTRNASPLFKFPTEGQIGVASLLTGYRLM